MIKQGLFVKKSLLLKMLLVIVWFTPYFFYRSIPNGGDILTLIRLTINFIYIYKTGIMKRLQRKDSIFLILFLLFSSYGMIFVSTPTFGRIVRFIEFSTFLFAVMGILSEKKEKSHELLLAIQIIGVLYGLLNLFIPPIKLTSGYGGEYFFLGPEAESVQLLSMMIIVSAFMDGVKYGHVSISTIIIAGTEFLFAIKNESGQGRIMVAVFILLLFFNKIGKEKIHRILRPSICVAAFFFINIVTITMRFQNWPIVQYIIEDILGKDMSLSGRDFIFTSCIAIFGEHPLMGFGFESTIVNDRLSHFFIAYNAAHNSFLQMLINSGLLGTICFTVNIWLSLRKIYQRDNDKMYYIYFGILALITGGLVNNVLLTSYFWLLIALSISL